MNKLLIALAIASTAAFRAPTSVVKPFRPAAAALDVESIKGSVAPADLGATNQALYSWVGAAVGVAGLAKPAWLAEQTLGIATNGATDVIIRGSAMAALLLGARAGQESEANAAKTALLWFGGWWYFLRGSTGVAGRTAAACGLIALSAARRSGGLWKFATSLDTDGLSSILPKNRDVTMRNIVGMQMMGWGFALWFAPQLVTDSIMGEKAAVAAVALKGLAVNNLVLGGKVMAGTEDSARTNGLIFFGAWTALSILAKNAGIASGQYLVPVIAWNAACAAYTVVS